MSDFSPVESTASSLRSKHSGSTSFADKQSLRRQESIDSESSFDETAASCTGNVSSTGVDEAEAEMSVDGTVISEESQDSLIAWRNQIKGIADGTMPAALPSNSTESEQLIHNWSAIYNANPELELTVLLLQVSL